MQKEICKNEALYLGFWYDIDFKVIKFNEWLYGLNVELEHKNITEGNPYRTAEIVISHLLEYPDYYKRLKKMEEKASEYWNKKIKKSIFKN